MAESERQRASPTPAVAGARRSPDWWPHGVVARYFDIWRRQLTGELDAVFSPQATYHEKPHLPAMAGLAAIREYWRREVETQRRTQVGYHVGHHDQASVDVEWSATFTRAGQRYVIQGWLRLHRDPADPSRVHRLEERFDTQRVLATAGCEGPAG